MQNFDQYGRLNQVVVDGISGAFTYGYLEGSHLQKTLAMPNGVTRTFGYEANRDLLTMIVHSNATERIVQRDFTFDGLGRLIDRTLVRASGNSSATPDAFGYNLRSELTNAVIGANAFAYSFDPIGNRNSATEFGTNTAYVASALNQYTSINPINPVNPVENFNPEFDLDGNQTLLKTTTGIWYVTYNGENRPILFSNDTTKIEMAYDYMGRRFDYKETVNNTLTRHERYLYRGYLQIAALDVLNSASVKHTIVWDALERVATRPLALQIGTNAYYYSFDQVKNATEMFDGSGAIAATYDYSPFGQVTSALSVGSSMLDVRSNPLTFSSEVSDSGLGLQYYNYRHLNVMDGRWVSRDLIEESGGVNLYGNCGNNTIEELDFLGLRALTSDEQKISQEMIFLANGQNVESGNREFAKALLAVVDDFKKMIADIPEKTKDPVRARVAIAALSYWSTENINLQYSASAGTGAWRNKNKCNKYVADVLEKAELDVKIIYGRAPRAGEWANVSLAGQYAVVYAVRPEKGEGPCVEVNVRGPIMGDIESFGMALNPGETPQMHVGIYLGHGLYVSVTTSKSPGQTKPIRIKFEALTQRRVYRTVDQNLGAQ